jgi:hypothetical protein
VNQVGRKKVPHKVLRYFPIIPRLQRLFISKQQAKIVRWHKERVQVENEMRHPADGNAWKDFDDTYPDFADDARNLRLAITTDGFNPFGQMTNSYSQEASDSGSLQFSTMDVYGPIQLYAFFDYSRREITRQRFPCVHATFDEGPQRTLEGCLYL